MYRSATRREALAACGLAASGGLGGCLLDNPEAGVGQLYIENTTEHDTRLALSVTVRGQETPEEMQGSEQVVDGVFDVPAKHALEVDAELEQGRTYEVRAAIEDGSSENRVSQVVEPCDEGGQGDEAGQRVVSVRTRPEALGVIPWGCQEEYSERNLEYVAADEYRVGTVEGTVAGTPAGTDAD